MFRETFLVPMTLSVYVDRFSISENQKKGHDHEDTPNRWHPN